MANTPIGSVLADEALDDLRAATPAGVLNQLALARATNDVTLNPVTLAVRIKAKISRGTYNLTYRLCKAVSPINCDTAATIGLRGKSN